MNSLKTVMYQKKMNQLYIQSISCGKLDEFNQYFDHHRNSKESFSLINIVSILFHFAKQRNKHEHAIMLDENKYVFLLNEFKEIPTRTSGALYGQGLGNLLYSFVGTNFESSHSAEMLHVLVHNYLPKVMKANILMKPQEIANAIYGLQNYSLQYNPVHVNNNHLLISVYSMLTLMLNNMKCNYANTTEADEAWTYFSSQDVGMLLYGLKNMMLLPTYQLPQAAQKDSVILEEFVCAIADKVIVGPPLSNSQAISNALYGLNNMSADVPGKRVSENVRMCVCAYVRMCVCAYLVNSFIFTK